MDNKFLCPICGSNSYEYLFFKNDPKWFGIKCSKCQKYTGWLSIDKQDSWKKGLIKMVDVEPSKETLKLINLSKILLNRGFKKDSLGTYFNENYLIMIDKQMVFDKTLKKTIDFDSFIKNIS